MKSAHLSLPGHDLVRTGLEDFAYGRSGSRYRRVVGRFRPIGCTRCSRRAALGLTVATTRSWGASPASPARPSMRPPVDAERIREFARRLGRVAASRTRIYLTGGATAVLEGWRASTVDVDVRFEPESDALLRELPALKERLGINVELASPPDFIPELPGWRERSPLVFRDGNLDVHHYDPYSQALSKIERGFAHDLADVQQMLGSGLVDPDRLRQLFEAIESQLYRYPAIDPAAFRRKVQDA